MSEDKLEHMRWQVAWRSKNQECCLQLFDVLKAHPKSWKKNNYFFASQSLIGAAFSLWRAVFLSEKDSKRAIVFDHSMNFLESVILDNAISYPLDKKNNEFTFNYYVNNARYRILDIARTFPELVPAWQDRAVDAKERWENAHKALVTTIQSFEDALAGNP